MNQLIEAVDIGQLHDLVVPNARETEDYKDTNTRCPSAHAHCFASVFQFAKILIASCMR